MDAPSQTDEPTAARYDNLFLTLYGGSAEACVNLMNLYDKQGVCYDYYEVQKSYRGWDHAKVMNDWRRFVKAKRKDPIFYDLRKLIESIDSIEGYMLPAMRVHAKQVAKALHLGRRVYINCAMGANRTFMFAIAVRVEYAILFGAEWAADWQEALTFLRTRRSPFKYEEWPQHWIKQGFSMIDAYNVPSLTQQDPSRRVSRKRPRDKPVDSRVIRVSILGHVTADPWYTYADSMS